MSNKIWFKISLKVIAAEGEHKSSRALKNAADILSESSSAIQLRYLQTLNNIAAEKNSTIVFPLPMEILSYFLFPNDSQHKKNSTHADGLSVQNGSLEYEKNRKKNRNKPRDLTDL